jgi:hypothetical protein
MERPINVGRAVPRLDPQGDQLALEFPRICQTRPRQFLAQYRARIAQALASGEQISGLHRLPPEIGLVPAQPVDEFIVQVRRRR